MFCRSCEDDHSTKVCGVSRKSQAKLLDEAGLADAGLADDERDLALASRRALPLPAEEIELLLAPDERGEGARAAAPPAAPSHDPEQRRRLGRVFQEMRAAILRDE